MYYLYDYMTIQSNYIIVKILELVMFVLLEIRNLRNRLLIYITKKIFILFLVRMIGRKKGIGRKDHIKNNG